jgi:hypothetical protein
MEVVLYVIIKDLVKDLIERYSQKRLTKRQKEFVIDVLLDIIRVNATTRHYIQENGGVFRGSVEIKNQFLRLHEKMNNANRIVEDLFPDQLLELMLMKSNFWDIPEFYYESESLLATVPTLEEIDNACKQIILNIKS